MYKFLSCCGGTSKCHLVKVIHNAMSKTFLYHCKDPEKPRVILLESTVISAVNRCGTTVHSGLDIKPGAKLLGLTDGCKAALIYRLSEGRILVIDKL